MIDQMLNNKEDVALELLRTNFSMIRDSINTLKQSSDQLRAENAKLRDKVDEEIMPIVLNQHRDIEILRDSMKELASSSSEFASSARAVSESIKKKIGLFESIGGKVIGATAGIFFSIRIIDELGLGSFVAKMLGW